MNNSTAAPIGAEIFLATLRSFDVEYIFAASGTEWEALWEVLAKQKVEGIKGPEFLLSRHEDLAIGMASGYAKTTGKLGVCLTHSSVGALRMTMGMRGAYQEGVPLLVCAGEAISFGEGNNDWVGTHWGRFLEDYGGPARHVETTVKAAYAVNHEALLSGAVARACQMAMNVPQGPIFLSIPFEYMVSPAQCAAPRTDKISVPIASCPDTDALNDLATLLLESRAPVFITERIGHSLKAVSDLVALAEMTGAAVLEGQQPDCVNFPRDHDQHCGYDAVPFFDAETDLVLVIDVIGPAWFPETAARPKKAKVVALGDDPLRERFPYYGIAAESQHITGRADIALAKLVELVRAAISKERLELTGARRKALADVNRQRRQQWKDDAIANAHCNPVDCRWLFHVLNDALTDDVIYVDEMILSGHLMRQVMNKLKPGQYINALDGGIGTGLGVALGVKIANPERQVIAIMGDGGINYNPPLAALGFCQEYEIPITIIVVDNGGYRSMQNGIKKLYPAGYAVKSDTYYGSLISPQIDYSAMAQLVNGYGEMVTEPDSIIPALSRALQANQEGRPAIMDIIVGDETEYLGSK